MFNFWLRFYHRFRYNDLSGGGRAIFLKKKKFLYTFLLVLFFINTNSNNLILNRAMPRLRRIEQKLRRNNRTEKERRKR